MYRLIGLTLRGSSLSTAKASFLARFLQRIRIQKTIAEHLMRVVGIEDAEDALRLFLVL